MVIIHLHFRHCVIGREDASNVSAVNIFWSSNYNK